VAKPLGKRRFEQGVAVEAAEDLVDGSAGSGGSDAGAFDLPPDPQSPALAKAGFSAGDRLGDPVVVDGAFLQQSRDGGLNGLGVVLAAGEALPDLSLRELASSEHFERVDIGPPGVHWGH
jgi:hypothetical protein